MSRTYRKMTLIGLAAGAVGLLVAGGPLGPDRPTMESMGQDEQVAGNPVQIVLPASGRTVLVWQDEAGSHYEIRADEQVLRRVEDTSYKLKLRYADFDPLNGDPPMHGFLQSQGLDGGVDSYIVQYVTQPLKDYHDDIAAAGGEVYSYLANHANIVLMDEQTVARVLALPYVRSISQYHAAYRLQEELLDAAGEAGLNLPPTNYSIRVLENDGLDHKNIIADRINQIGGRVTLKNPEGFLLEAMLTGDQLLEIVTMPEVQFVDVPGERETDMDIARAIGGGNYVESVGGYVGTGVRAEVMDGNLRGTHPDFQHHPPIFHGGHSGDQSHGTLTYGVNFGDGTNRARARGMVPDAQGIFADFGNLTNRFEHTRQLVNSPYFAVYQSNSWGNPRTTQYTNISAQMDSIIFTHDIVIMQSQSNSGNTQSRPQAWAKNIVAVGGVNHRFTLTKTDDAWGGASTGPAADGRVKPDLTHFYDGVTTTASNGGYGSLGGTSGATPIVAGHFGLLFQMWADGIFGNTVDPNGTVFENRPHATTARALIINSAEQYPFVGLNHNLRRMRQGWGMPDLRQLYDDRGTTFIVNEEEVLANLQTASYVLPLDPGAPEFRATMIYADVSGTTSAALHRINDLTLKVTAPDGTVYWGNNGLADGVWSDPGGAADQKNTVENVFIQNPQAGDWTVEVTASEINADGHVETGAVDADFALVVAGVIPPSAAVAALTDVTRTLGIFVSGGVAELRDSDDRYYVLQSGPGFDPSEPHPARMDVGFDTGGFAPSTLDVTVEERANIGGPTAVVLLRNWTSGQFDELGQQALGTNDQMFSFNGVVAADYVNGANRVEVRVRTFAVLILNPAIRGIFSHDMVGLGMN